MFRVCAEVWGDTGFTVSVSFETFDRWMRGNSETKGLDILCPKTVVLNPKLSQNDRSNKHRRLDPETDKASVFKCWCVVTGLDTKDETFAHANGLTENAQLNYLECMYVWIPNIQFL